VLTEAATWANWFQPTCLVINFRQDTHLSYMNSLQLVRSTEQNLLCVLCLQSADTLQKVHMAWMTSWTCLVQAEPSEILQQLKQQFLHCCTHPIIREYKYNICKKIFQCFQLPYTLKHGSANKAIKSPLEGGSSISISPSTVTTVDIMFSNPSRWEYLTHCI
jgi:hypothetical protein